MVVEKIEMVRPCRHAPANSWNGMGKGTGGRDTTPSRVREGARARMQARERGRGVVVRTPPIVPNLTRIPPEARVQQTQGWVLSPLCREAKVKATWGLASAVKKKTPG